MREVLELPFFLSPPCLNSDLLPLPVFHPSLLDQMQVHVDLTVNL